MKKLISLAIAASLISLCALHGMDPQLREKRDCRRTRTEAINKYATQIYNITEQLEMLANQEKHVQTKQIEQEILELLAKREVLLKEYNNLIKQ